MMTEIQWLVDIMLHHKLPAPVREMFIARIGEVERTLSKGPIVYQPPVPITPRSTGQAPSMQRIMDEMAVEGAPIPPIPPSALPIKPPSVGVDKETGRPMVSTGRGTVGPRKF